MYHCQPLGGGVPEGRHVQPLVPGAAHGRHAVQESGGAGIGRGLSLARLPGRPSSSQDKSFSGTPSIVDTLGTWWGVLYREVSSFQGVFIFKKHTWDIAKCP